MSAFGAGRGSAPGRSGQARHSAASGPLLGSVPAEVVVPASDESDAQAEDEDEEEAASDSQQEISSDAGSTESELDFRATRLARAPAASSVLDVANQAVVLLELDTATPSAITHGADNNGPRHDPRAASSRSHMQPARRVASRGKGAAPARRGSDGVSDGTSLPVVDATPSPEPDAHSEPLSPQGSAPSAGVDFDDDLYPVLGDLDELHTATLELSPDPEDQGSSAAHSAAEEVSNARIEKVPSKEVVKRIHKSRTAVSRTFQDRARASQDQSQASDSDGTAQIATASGSLCPPSRKRRKLSPPLIPPRRSTPAPELDPSANHIAWYWAAQKPVLPAFWSTFAIEDYDGSELEDDDHIPMDEAVETHIRLDAMKEKGLTLEDDYDIDLMRDGAELQWLRRDDFQDHLIDAVTSQCKTLRDLRKARSAALSRITKMVKTYWAKKADVQEKQSRAEERRLKNLAKWTGREVLKQWKLAADLVGDQKEEVARKEYEIQGRKQLNAILEQSTQMLNTQRQDLYGPADSPCSTDDATDSAQSEPEDSDDGGDIGQSDAESDTEAIDRLGTSMDILEGGADDGDHDFEPSGPLSHDSEASLIDDSGASLVDDSGASLIDDSGGSLSGSASESGGDSESESDTSDPDAANAEADDEPSTSEMLEIPSKAESSKWWARFLVEDEIRGPPSSMPGIEEVDDDDNVGAGTFSPRAKEEAIATETGNASRDAPDQPPVSSPASQQPLRPRSARKAGTSSSLVTEVVRPKRRRSFSRSVSVLSQDASENGNTGKDTLPRGKPRVRIPFLLRGVLRPYQHVGLDWLASLYTNKVNGILADEMGLGKTIQTIALLAHLACEYGNWGPHLVVAPTSVMMNWEVEFKKFLPGFKILTYYGTQKERKEKRVGWALPHAFNVCITSYQLTLADASILRRRAWQYLILDEAHHIKNFRSQRWQTLLGFNAQRRLLLTGTPLQNNLLDLWSLMYFLMPQGLSQSLHGYEAFASLQDFQHWFSKPIDKAIEAGGPMSEETRDMISKLHTVLRPYLLRRLKKDVEKELPSKHEHVITCRLSKRQRFLYNDFMSRAKTKESLASGTYLSIINCLMQLRKVCNHPDLFEERPIVTSFAMGRSAVADFEIEELFLRKHFLDTTTRARVSLDTINGNLTAGEELVPIVTRSIKKLAATTKMPYYSAEVPQPLQLDTWSIDAFPKYRERNQLINKVQRWKHFATLNASRCERQPIYGAPLIEMLCTASHSLAPLDEIERDRAGYFRRSDAVHAIVKSNVARKSAMNAYIDRFAVVTPAVTTSDLSKWALPEVHADSFPQFRNSDFDTLHSISTKLHIAFPDASLLQYDCGKLQQLSILMRRLKQDGHRILIFTQMTKMLDILESFLNYHNYRYLRLDGATKVDQRQLLTERFNRDPKIDAFILSTRSGGLGINLVGADTVLFYDLDWNAAIEAQCMDRAHRIGQTRDVHIYRFVSEHTVEENMLRKANQKRKLDSVVIQDGEFNTDTLVRNDWRDMFDEGGQTIAGVPVGRAAETLGADADRHLKAVEDEEDVQAAAVAEEEGALDQEDYEVMGEPTAGEQAEGREADPVAGEEESSIDSYMINFVTAEWEYFEHLYNK